MGVRKIVGAGICLCIAAGSIVSAGASTSYDLVFDTGKNTQVLGTFVEGKYKHTFTNTGSETDTYNMVITGLQSYTFGEFDALWTMCNSVACVTPDFVSQITLAPAESDTVTLKVFTNGPGSSRINLQFWSEGTDQEYEFSYIAIGDGTPTIIIDDDPETSYEEYVANGLAALAEPHGVYETGVEALEDFYYDLDFATQLIYLSGDQSTNTITAGDATFLGDYLEQGGNLVASGQDLFDDIGGSAFANDYLRVDRASTTSELAVYGVDGYPVSDGVSFGIEGGPNNQVSQDVLTAVVPVFEYGDGSVAGGLYETPGFKTLSLGFGLEAAGSPLASTTLSEFLQQVLDWFEAPILSTPDAGLNPSVVGAAMFPNPMRSSGTLRLAVPDGYQGAVQVTIYDATGRAVRELRDGQLGVGEIGFDGRDASGNLLPAGVYHYRMLAGASSAGGKFTLIR